MRIFSRAFCFLVFAGAGLAQAAEHIVTAELNLRFVPAQLDVKVGDTVTFVNRGGFHNVVADDLSFRCADGCDGEAGNGNPSPASWRFSLVMDQPGERPYFCEIHGAAGGVGMAGVIRVEP